MSRATRPWLLWCFAAVLASGFASLGVWQLGRRAEKAQMLRDAGAALAERSPQSLSVLGDAGRARAYDWITVSGRFADAPPVLLDNQQRDGRVGVRAYRLFLVEGASPVLVELGWLPLPPDRRLPTVPAPPAQRFAGLLLPPPGQGLRLAPPAPQSGGALLATALDLPQLGATLGAPTLALRVLRPAPDAGFGYVRDFEILPNTLPPERHLGYAVQWFALSAATAVIALLLTFRARRRARAF